MEGPVHDSSQRPVGGVGELRTGRVRRHGVVEHHRDLEHDLLPGRDRGEAAEGEQPPRVRDREGHRSATALPGGATAHVAERYPGRIEVVSDRDLADVLVRPVGIDDAARRCADQQREGERVGKGHPDRDQGRPRRVLLVDLVDRCEEVRALQDMLAGDRAVDEPDDVIVYVVAGDVADEVDVVEDEQRVGRAQQTDVAPIRVGGRVVPDGAGAVDLQIRRHRGDVAVEDAAVSGVAERAALRVRRAGAHNEQCEAEQQECHPAAARSDVGSGPTRAQSHTSCRSIASTRAEAARVSDWSCGGPAVVELWRLFRPVTLRPHLSVGLPLSCPGSADRSGQIARPQAAGRKSIG